jgi:tetratricopeptide (TPR) repeat protein
LALGRAAEATESLEQALSLHRERLPDPGAAREVARTLSSLARLAEILSRPWVTPVDPSELLAGVQTPHDRYVVAVTMGYLAGRDGDQVAALDLLATALAAARSAGYRPGVVTTLFDLGWNERRAGRELDARAHLTECLALASALGRRPMEARAHNELGELARARGDLSAARRHYVDAVSLAQHVDGPEPLIAELNLALLESIAGEARHGKARLQSMRDDGRVPPWLVAPWTLTMALAESTLGDVGAHARLEAGIAELTGSGGAVAEAAEILLKIAAVCAEKGADASAERARTAAEHLLAAP